MRKDPARLLFTPKGDGWFTIQCEGHTLQAVREGAHTLKWVPGEAVGGILAKFKLEKNPDGDLALTNQAAKKYVTMRSEALECHAQKSLGVNERFQIEVVDTDPDAGNLASFAEAANDTEAIPVKKSVLGGLAAKVKGGGNKEGGGGGGGGDGDGDQGQEEEEGGGNSVDSEGGGGDADAEAAEKPVAPAKPAMPARVSFGGGAFCFFVCSFFFFF